MQGECTASAKYESTQLTLKQQKIHVDALDYSFVYGPGNVLLQSQGFFMNQFIYLTLLCIENTVDPVSKVWAMPVNQAERPGSPEISQFRLVNLVRIRAREIIVSSSAYGLANATLHVPL